MRIEFLTGFDSAWPAPREISSFRPRYRLAVIQDTFVPGAADPVLDPSLYSSIATALDGQFRPSSFKTISARDTWLFSRKTRAAFADVEALIAHSVSDDEFEPPDIIFLNGEPKLLAAVFVEKWYAFGGPDTYHDSITYSIYTQTDIASDMIAAIREQARTAGWDVDGKLRAAVESG